MHPTLCSNCKKNVAVIFITKIENGKTVNDGLCLKCARQLGIKPVDDIMKQMGVTDEDLETLSDEMMHMMGNASAPGEVADTGEDDETDSRTATFPFLNKLFGSERNDQLAQPTEPEQPKEKASGGRKFLQEPLLITCRTTPG